MGKRGKPPECGTPNLCGRPSSEITAVRDRSLNSRLLFWMLPANSLAGTPDDLPSRSIGIENRIEALFFHRGIAHVWIAFFPIGLSFDRPRRSAKGPKVGTGDMRVTARLAAN